MPEPRSRQRQPWDLTAEEWQRLVEQYTRARQEMEAAQKQLRRYTDLYGAQVPATTPGLNWRAPAAQYQVERLQPQVSQYESYYPALQQRASWAPEAMIQYASQYIVDREGGGAPLGAAEKERILDWTQRYAGVGRAGEAATTAELPPLEGTEQFRPGYVEGMTAEEEAAARAMAFGLPTPEQARQQQWQEQWQQRLWQADLEQSASAEKRSQQQAEWARQQDIYENAYRQAQLAQQRWAEAMPWAMTPGRQYKPGFQPGGPISKFYEMGGMQYNPELYKPVYTPAPGNNLGALNMALMQMAQQLGQGG